jgi:membrane protease YdiL (CAAX protease family)
MNYKNYIRRHPVSSYFQITFAISWLGAFIIAAPKLFRGQPIPKMDGILMFPIMLAGPVGASIILTSFTEGKSGLRNIWTRMGKWKVPVRWYIPVLILPPCLIMLVLFFLKNFISPAFTANSFYFGFLFGVPAGFFEEIGWTGYALPKMRQKLNFVQAGVTLGLFWGLWHLPVIDFLGAASPHGKYLFLFFLAFTGILTAMRVLIAWVYSNTGSILLAQLMHAVSTGSLAMLGPAPLSPGKETLWYASYAVLLWITVLIIVTIRSRKKTDAH